MEEKVTHRKLFANTEKFVNTTGFKLPKDYISVSQVNTWHSCGMQYYFEYIEKRPKTAPSMLVGNVAHTFLEMAWKGNLDGLDDQGKYNFYDNLFVEFMDSIPTDLKKDISFEEYATRKRNQYRSLKMYMEQELPTLNILGVEVEVFKNLDIVKMEETSKGKYGLEKVGKLACAGFVDYINDPVNKKPVKNKDLNFDDIVKGRDVSQLQLGDYKTGNKKPDGYIDLDLQMNFYAYATNITKIRIDNILTPQIVLTEKTGKMSTKSVHPSYDPIPGEINLDRFSYFQKKISDAVVNIGNNIYPEAGDYDWKCAPGVCPHWHYCKGRIVSTPLKRKSGSGEFVDKKYWDLPEMDNNSGLDNNDDDIFANTEV